MLSYKLLTSLSAFLPMLVVSGITQAQPHQDYDPWQAPHTGGLLSISNKNTTDNNPVLHWNGIALEVIRLERLYPPQASRMLAIFHLSIDDAISRADQSDPHALAAVVAFASHEVLRQMYPSQQEGLDQALAEALDGINTQTTNMGELVGRQSATRILTARQHDGSGDTSDYQHTHDIGKWRPTRPTFRPGLLPQWGDITPFALEETRAYWPVVPPTLTSDVYTSEVLEIIEVGEYYSESRTDEETEIAQYWAEQSGTATPPGGWNRTATVLSENAILDPIETSHLFTILNVGIADATIVCWEAKYGYDYWRPITAIALADQDGNEGTSPVDGWTPLITTPPFPDYPSGHSMMSGAASEILARWFGEDVGFELISDNLPLQFSIPDVVRSFDNVRHAAKEASLSRLYGGIHYRFSCVEGVIAGEIIGARVWDDFSQAEQRGDSFLLY